jgi:type IV pilus assembly protein PilQ
MKNTSHFIPLTAVLALMLAAPCSFAEESRTVAVTQTAEAANSIESIDYATTQGGKIMLKLGMKQALQTTPAGFTISNPPRIALDFPNTSNGLGKSSLNIGEDPLRSLNIVQAGNRTRLVLNLNKPVQYETRIEDKYLLVTLQGAESAASSSNVTARFAESKPATAAKHSVQDIDFRRGKNGEGRVVITLSDATTGIDIRQQGKNIVVDFINAGLPANLQRRLDVLDFGTPVQTVDAFSQGNNTRLVIEPKGLWEHSAYQTDNQFIVEVKPVIEDPNKIAQGAKPKYSGDKLSLNFQNVEVRSVLQVIADFTGLNIITSDTVTGNLTLRLKDVPWDQALDIILQSKGLAMRKSGNVILIAPSDELATKEKLALEAKKQIEELEPLYTESFSLKYQKAQNFLNVFNDAKQSILSKRGSAVVDPRTNTLFIQDTPAKLDELRHLIQQVDVPLKQVMIESRIVIADDKFSKALGARFGLQSPGRANNLQTGTSGNLTSSSGIAAGTAPSGGGDLNVNLPVNGATGTFALTLLRLGTGTLVNLELSALEADKRGKVISSPRVITADKQKATIEQGTEIPYQQATSSGATSVSFKSATLSLSVTPQITPDDKVIMDLEVKKDSVGNVFAGVPSIDTRKVTTQILVDNGETAVLGGIYEQTQRNDVDKVPGFGDLPLLGGLFRNTVKQDDKSELLIFITPKILKDSASIR